MKYFQSASTIFEEKETKARVVFLLRNCKHATMVGYNSQDQQWFFPNPEGWPYPVINIQEAREIAQQTMSAFRSTTCTAFSTTIYVSQPEAEAVRKAIEAWQCQCDWKESPDADHIHIKITF